MKILMVNKFLFPKGGAEAYMFELGKQLEKIGCEVQYFGMDNKERCVSNELGLYVDEIDFHASAAKKLLSPFKTIYSKEAAKKIGAVLDSFMPDAVHLNNINFQLTPSIIYEAKKRNIPVVQTVHDVQIACPNHRMYIEQSEKVCTECIGGGYLKCIKNKCVQGSSLKSAVAAAESIYYHKKNTYNLIDRYVCPSRFIAEQIKTGGVEEKRITVLPNYSPYITESYKSENSVEKYIIYFGRISVEKGLRQLFDVIEKLPQVKFVIAGTGPLEEELRARGLANAEFAGFKSGRELYSLIANATASVYPSVWFENCPMSIIESIKLSTPVIASDAGGSKELIENGKNGIIYPAGDGEALKAAIEKIYFSEDTERAMSAYCLERGSTDTLDIYAEKLMNIYRELKV